MGISCFFYRFISWIAQEAQFQNIKKIYFFTREGEFFYKLYNDYKTYWEKCVECGLCEDRLLPDADILEVSRMSTFFPSLREISVSEMRRIWNQYSEQSMNSLFRSLNLKTELFQNELEKYRIAADEIIVHPWVDDRVQRLFRDEIFLSKMIKARDRARSLLQEYLGQKGWNRQSRIGIVDIGWRGTIQDNLCYLYPEYRIIGFYMGLQAFLSEQLENAEKFGYIDDFPFKKSILFTVRPIEMLCGSSSGSTIGYERRNDIVYPVKKTDSGEHDVYDRYSSKRQSQIQQRLRNQYYRSIKQCRLNDNNMMSSLSILNCSKRTAQWQLFLYDCVPDKETVDAYFSLNQNEEFGEGRFISMDDHYSLYEILVRAFKKNGWKEIIDILKQTSWPQGYFKRKQLSLVLPVYNILLALYLKNKRI